MKKMLPFLVVATFLIPVVLATGIPAAQQAKDNAKADNSPVINPDWELEFPY